MDTFRKKASDLLKHADVTINGNRKCDILVHNDELFKRVFAEGSLGLGEAYVECWWDCEARDDFFYRVLSAGLDTAVIRSVS